MPMGYMTCSHNIRILVTVYVSIWVGLCVHVYMYVVFVHVHVFECTRVHAYLQSYGLNYCWLCIDRLLNLF